MIQNFHHNLIKLLKKILNLMMMIIMYQKLKQTMKKIKYEFLLVNIKDDRKSQISNEIN